MFFTRSCRAPSRNSNHPPKDGPVNSQSRNRVASSVMESFSLPRASSSTRVAASVGGVLARGLDLSPSASEEAQGGLSGIHERELRCE